uniref:MULE transposase domain-containing protein n=1 Tax=Tanacetum cinerariifolium TaxID=118510 RepID=A0A699GNM1_TANCI|nr:hypothetical protein [Tanacetum cinerariifolium]
MKIIINHGGTFTTPPKISYKGGKVIWVDDIDSDIFSIVEITKPLVVGTTSKPNEPDISSGSEAEVDVSKDEWLQEALKKLHINSQKGSGSGSDSQDNDYFMDEENLIDDVEVDMADFKSHTDPDVEWVGCKETIEEENQVFKLEEVDHEECDNGSDLDEGVRRKALRKVARMHKAKAGKGETIWKENFFVREQFSTSKLVKDKEVKTLEDNHKCLQSRIVKKCKASFLPREVEESITLNPYIPLSSLKDQFQKKIKVGVSNQKVFRAKKMAYERVVVKIEVERPQDPDSEERKFKRIYVCLGPLKEGLRAVGVDPNNGIYPLAYAVVESENKDSWKWFLECLGDYLDLFKNSNFTFISNRQKGVIPVIVETFPSVEHRQLVDGMDKPIITCLEYIREYLVKRIVNVQKVQDKCDGPLTPNAAKVFKFIVTAAKKLKNGSDLYQVTCPWGDQFVVNITERVCSYRKWELSGMPCSYAVAAIWNMASNGTDTGIHESYCNPCHWLSTWKEMYMFKINPVNGPRSWEKSDVPTTIIPPKPQPQIDRPLKKREKSTAKLADEMMKSKKLTRTGKSVTCSLCNRLVTIKEVARVKEVLEMPVLVVHSKVEMLVLVVHSKVEMLVLVVHRQHIL